MDRPNEDISKVPINLHLGWPSTSLLPVDLIREATQAVLSDTSIAHDGLLYGPDAGYEPARRALAEWLTSFYQPGRAVESGRICITGGASQNLGCMLSVYTDPEYTRNIWIVVPAYMLAFGIFEDAGFGDKMRAVPEDAEGIDLSYLRQEIEKSEKAALKQGNTTPRFKPRRPKAKVYKHVIYCVPTFSNPSSRTMSLDRRRELVQLARNYDALVITDDVYDFLQWPNQDNTSSAIDAKNELATFKTAHLPRLVDIDRDLDGGPERDDADGFGNAFSNGSFSKIAGPGLRAGWVEGSEKFAFGASQAGISRSGGAPCQLTSTYLTRLITTGQIQKHIQTVLLPAYATRYRILMQAIDSHLIPLGFRKPQPDRNIVGGYFVWLSLPTGLKAEEFTISCKEDENLIISSGEIFQVPGDDSVKFEGSIRVSFAWEDVEKFSKAVRRIARVAERMLAKIKEASNEYVIVEQNREDGSL